MTSGQVGTVAVAVDRSHRGAPHLEAPRSRLLSTLQIACLVAAVASVQSALAGLGNAALKVEIGGAALVLGVAAQWLRHRHRPRAVSATEVFLLVAFLHLCVIPLVDIWFGEPQLDFRTNASPSAAAHAELVSLLFAAAIILGASRTAIPGVRVSPIAPVSRRGVGWWMTVVGGVALFSYLQGSLSLLLSGTTFTQAGAGGGGVKGLAETIGRALLPIGAYLVVGAARSRSGRIALGVVLAPATILALASFSLNRAAILLPILAMVLSWQRFSERPSRFPVAMLLFVGVIAFFLIGQYRSDVTLAAHHQTAQSTPRSELVKGTVDVYGQSPYLTGIVYDDPTEAAFVPTTPLASVLSPIPAIGRSYRPSAGSAVYNATIYGYGTADQIVPTWLEVQSSWGYGGLFVVGVGFGLLLRWAERVTERTQDRLAMYLATLAGLWLAQAPIASLEVLTQIAVYFLALPVLLAWVTRLGNSPGRKKATQ